MGCCCGTTNITNNCIQTLCVSSSARITDSLHITVSGSSTIPAGSYPVAHDPAAVTSPHQDGSMWLSAPFTDSGGNSDILGFFPACSSGGLVGFYVGCWPAAQYPNFSLLLGGYRDLSSALSVTSCNPADMTGSLFNTTGGADGSATVTE